MVHSGDMLQCGRSCFSVTIESQCCAAADISLAKQPPLQGISAAAPVSSYPPAQHLVRPIASPVSLPQPTSPDPRPPHQVGLRSGAEGAACPAGPSLPQTPEPASQSANGPAAPIPYKVHCHRTSMPKLLISNAIFGTQKLIPKLRYFLLKINKYLIAQFT